MYLNIARAEAAATLQERLIAGMSLMCKTVNHEHEYAELRARAMNWQTINFTFLRGAFRQKHHAANYQAIFMSFPKEEGPLYDRVSRVRAALKEHLLFLHSMRLSDSSVNLFPSAIEERVAA